MGLFSAMQTRSMRQIGLGGCSLGDTEAMKIAAYLKITEAPLAKLFLDQNCIGVAGGTAICEALTVSMAPLEKLQLDKNEISDEAKSSLREQAIAAIPLLVLSL